MYEEGGYWVVNHNKRNLICKIVAYAIIIIGVVLKFIVKPSASGSIWYVVATCIVGSILILFEIVRYQKKS
ncbi:MAG: hypothetical protein U0L23_06595 [Lachnospiraceae bacterium]|nr:hypothetical protein [Lachnospiraceae bacterium]MEE1342371.1 hypothetical protein [Lachnospiraceae bacterium]